VAIVAKHDENRKACQNMQTVGRKAVSAEGRDGSFEYPQTVLICGNHSKSSLLSQILPTYSNSRRIRSLQIVWMGAGAERVAGCRGV
jgi:hypothetical protein